MTLEEVLGYFAKEMLVKFYLRAPKHGESSYTLVGDRDLGKPGTHGVLWRHYTEELKELAETRPGSEQEAAEAIDVANMAFLLWWQNKMAERRAREVRA